MKEIPNTELKITLEQALAMYKTKDKSLQELACSIFDEEDLKIALLPDKYENLGVIKGIGFFAGRNYQGGKLIETYHDATVTAKSLNLNVFYPDEAHAHAALAVIKLLHLKKVYNGEWIPDYETGTVKYSIIHTCESTIELIETRYIRRILTFKTRPIAQYFFKNFQDLIQEAKILL